MSAKPSWTPEIRNLFIVAVVALVLGAISFVGSRYGPESPALRLDDDRLVELLTDPEIPRTERLARQIIEAGRTNIFFRAARDERSTLRGIAAKFLRHAADRRLARLVLLRLVRDEDDHVRMFSVWSLGGVGEPRDIPLLETLAVEDEFFNARQHATEAIAEIRSRSIDRDDGAAPSFR